MNLLDTKRKNSEVYNYLYKYPIDEWAVKAFEKIDKQELTEKELVEYNECEEFLAKHTDNATLLVGHARSPFYVDSVMYEKEGSKRTSLEVKDNKIFLGDALWDESGWNAKYDLLDFVVMPDGELRIGLKHFWMADTAPFVYGAGRMIVSREGDIEYIDNHSGHYTPSAEQFQKTLKLLDYLSIKHSYTRTVWE